MLDSAQQRITAALAASGFELEPSEHRVQARRLQRRARGGPRGRLRAPSSQGTPQSGGNPMVPENHVQVTVTHDLRLTAACRRLRLGRSSELLAEPPLDRTTRPAI